MPANLPPDYFEAEKDFREAKTPEAKVEALEEMLSIIPKHKGTDKLRANLRRRLSKVKEQSQKKKGVSKRKAAFSIDREGAAQVAVIGPPNAGKSSLIDLLTNTSPEIADFPHTTQKPMPGMAPYEDIQYQLIDTPPLTKEYMEPLMGDLIRRADILVVLLDLYGSTLQQYEDVMDILHSLRVYADESEVPADLKKPPFIKKILIAINKMDKAEDIEDLDVFMELTDMRMPCIGMSVHTGKNISLFMKHVFDLSEVIRVYTKSPGKEPDMKAPYVIPRDSTLEELAGRIHKDFVRQLKSARIWGRAVRDGQMVQRDYVMHDCDIVEIHV
ncbi:MAG: 50S ribosome-binding GTPase [Deltaproteobacteria bacterium]|nr:50S ribosome-binding GTPase [Deltaproteobacteria bacterium]